MDFENGAGFNSEFRCDESSRSRSILPPKRAPKTNCPGSHGAKKFETDTDTFGCDECKTRQPLGATMWGCRICDWDACTWCFVEPKKSKKDESAKKSEEPVAKTEAKGP